MKDPLAVLEAIDRLEVGPARLAPNRLIATYKIILGRKTDSLDLIYKYEDNVFAPGEQSSQNLADMIAAQIALNYGLFAREIVFRGRFDSHDMRFLKEMGENTAREIYVKKFLEYNPFLVGPAAKLPTVKMKSYLRSKLVFAGGSPPKTSWQTDQSRYAVLSSGGKDSLLSFGLLDEMGYETHPIFVNESGRHWYTALNSYRYFQRKYKNTGRIWTNSDRLFNWMLRHLPFIRKDFAGIRADEYPIRLWTVPVFIFGAIPLLRKRGLGRLIIGNEYDTTRRYRHKGIPHYDGLYDQSRFFDNAMSRYFAQKGWGIRQLSILRPLSELMIEKILVQRYPDLQRQQVSCHATHIKRGRACPCGNCEKCRRIVGMLLALDADPRRCGYTATQIGPVLMQLANTSLRQDAASAEHLVYLLSRKDMLPFLGDIRKPARPHHQIEKLMFDREKSLLSEFPADIRGRLLDIYLEHAGGCVRRQGGEWVDFSPAS
ncbi:MAG: hypothetical protein A2W25_11215 [candidate division Zixibacteria bacterium RBG_16_53_22]|nr:MAG: hypothetical protein A2W25_11215 [candidate division Zixibacteria bacterium RBG_16_53_22]